MNIAEMNELYEMIKCPINQEIPRDPVRMEQLRGGTGHGGNADADMRNQIWSMQALQAHYNANGRHNFFHPLTREQLPFRFHLAFKQTTMISLAIRYNIQIRRATGQPVDRNMQDIETDVNNYLRGQFNHTTGEALFAEFIRNPAGPIRNIRSLSAETCAVIRRKYNPQTLQTGIIPLPRCIEQEILKVRAEENRIAESNRYADQMVLAGQNRTAAFYAYYNRQTEPQRVAAANRWADAYFVDTLVKRPLIINCGLTRTHIFYSYYSGTDAHRRSADSIIENLETNVANANRYADQVATLGRDRHTALCAYYNADSDQIRQNLTNALATDVAAAVAAAAAARAAEAARVTAANLYADHAVTLPGRDRTTAFYAHYNAKSEEERQVLLNRIQVAKVNADAAAQAENERVNASNRYADQMVLNGQDRTAAFYAYYNRQTEQQRVTTANQYADQVAAIPGQDRTTAFYAYYNASSAQERKMLEDALSVSVATARMESECVAAANQQADVAARNGADRTTSFFTHYTSVKERERVKSANLYADYARSIGQDRTGSFYTHYNAKSAEERQVLEDQISIPRRNLINAF